MVWDPSHQLLEAKGRGRADVLDFLWKLGRSPKMLKDDSDQAHRQIKAAQGRPVDWHAAERRYRDALENALFADKIARPPTFGLYHTPAL